MDPAANREAAREREEQRSALPDEVRERIVLEECRQAERWEALELVAGRRWRRPVLEGAVLFLSFMALVTGFEPVATLAGAALGALIGLAWHVSRAGQLTAPLLAMPSYMLLMVWWGDVGVLACLCSPFPLGAVAGLLALQRQDWTHC